MNVFELFAKLGLDTSEFDRGVRNASRDFDSLGDAANEISGDTGRAERAVDDFANSITEAGDDSNRAESALNDAERAVRNVGDEAKETAPSLEETAENLADVGESGSGASDGLSGLGKTITGAVTKGTLLASLATTLAAKVMDFAKSVWNMDEATEDFRVSMGKLTTAFSAAGYSSAAAKQTFGEVYALLGDTETAVEASQLLAKLTTNMQDQARWTRIATGVNGTFGDSLPINGLIEAANETAKVGQVTGVLADALNWVGISEDDFNLRLASCADTAERTALITDTLASAYENAAAAMQESNEVVMRARESQLRLQDAQAKVGEQTSRLKTAFSNIFAPSVEKVLGFVERLTGGIADIAEEWEETANSIRNPLPTESVEDAQAQLDAWRSELEETNARLQEVIDSGGQYENEYWQLIAKQDDLNSKIANGREQIEGMAEAESIAAEESAAAAEAIDTMTVSANGFSVEMQNSTLTLEEATERLKTYTDAATNMFTKISTDSELSYEELTGNLRHNIDATTAFAENMAAISSELPAEMAEMFYSGGPEMYAGIVAMLAEASNGSDEGLAELRALWEEGGQAAIEAFAQSVGAVNTEENPATKLSEAMDSDASAEQAATDLVNRTADAVLTQVNAASFFTSGQTAVDRFIAGMANKKRDAVLAAQNIVNAADGAMSGSGGTGRYSAGGLDYVPYDNYPAMLHRGESVLTKAEAEDWRRGTSENSSGVTIVQNIQSVPQTPVELAAATAAYFEMARWAI